MFLSHIDVFLSPPTFSFQKELTQEPRESELGLEGSVLHTGRSLPPWAGAVDNTAYPTPWRTGVGTLPQAC